MGIKTCFKGLLSSFQKMIVDLLNHKAMVPSQFFLRKKITFILLYCLKYEIFYEKTFSMFQFFVLGLKVHLLFAQIYCSVSSVRLAKK